MIPEVAVEAAAKAIYEGYYTSYSWEDAPDWDGGFKAIAIKQATLAVNAATPHIIGSQA
jgi:hypothetical protein